MTDEDVINARSRINKSAELKGNLLVKWCSEYYALFDRLRLEPDQVEGYFRQERRLLARLYFAARELPPSRDALRRLAYRLAVDARAQIVGDLTRYEPRLIGVNWRVGVHDLPRTYGPGFPPPGGYITALSPLAEIVLGHVQRQPLEALRLADWIEVWFGRQPERRDAEEVLVGPVVFYETDPAGRIRLWVGDTEVTGIGGSDSQALLKHFCARPDVESRGEQLRAAVGRDEITNPSRAAATVRQALRRARPEAEDWFLTKPLRWKEGVTVRVRPAAGC